MAKKHKKHRRRRHVPGFGGGKKGTMLKLAAIAGGYLLADKINEQIGKYVTTSSGTSSTGAALTVPNTKLMMGGEIGLGALLLLRKGKGTTGMVMTVAGGLLAGAGLKLALKQAGVITGYHNVPVIGRHRMASGYQSVPVIGGTPAQLSGTPGQLQGYRVGQYGSQGSGVIAGFKGAANGSGIMTSGSGYMQ